MWADVYVYTWRPLSSAAVCLTPNTGVPCSNVANTRNPVEITWGVPNNRTDLSR